MIPLNKLENADKVLPVKMTCAVHDKPREHMGGCQCFEKKVFNSAIDKYNQVMLDGDVEKLAKEIFLSEHSSRTEEDWNDFSRKNIYRLNAHRLIPNLDKFLVLKKATYNEPTEEEMMGFRK